MIIFARIFSAVFAAIVLSRSIVDYRDKKESLQMTIFWVIVWIAIIAIAFFPALIDGMIKALGGDRSGLGTVLGMGLVFVMFVSYRIYAKANRIEKQIAKLTREVALQHLRNSKQK